MCISTRVALIIIENKGIERLSDVIDGFSFTKFLIQICLHDSEKL